MDTKKVIGWGLIGVGAAGLVAQSQVSTAAQNGTTAPSWTSVFTGLAGMASFLPGGPYPYLAAAGVVLLVWK